MRTLMLAIATLFYSLPVAAQSLPSGVLALIERLNVPAATEKGVPSKPPLILIGPSDVSAQADKIEAPLAGWVTYRMSVCGAAIIGGNQYVFIITTSGLAAATQSQYATPIIAANCASGKTFSVYYENDGSVSGIGSFVSS